VSRVKKPNSLRFRKVSSPAGVPAAIAAALGVAASHGAWAQAAASPDADNEDSNAIELIEVYGVKNAPYKARRSGDQRRTADLAATPSTMTILTQSQILDSGRTDLKEILAAQAGITLGTGENGNAFGDRYIIRGHEARSDVFVDGVRDPGMTTRESFATEQIEISKGPSSTFAGRGSSGGAVNGITKQASPDFRFAVAELGLGTDERHRATLDINQPLSESVALRANLLHADENVPDREPAQRLRVGGLLSATWQATERLSIVGDYYRLAADDVPDLGSYFDSERRKPVKGIPVYLQDGDFLDTDVESYTGKLTYEFSDALQLQNTTRYGRTDNGYVTTGARGTNRDDTDPDAPGAATFSLSTHQGWQEVDYFVNQMNLLWETDAGGLHHQLVFGAEYSSENVTNGIFDINTSGATNCVLTSRSGAPSGGYCGLDATGNVVPDLNSLMGRDFSRGRFDSDSDIDTVSAYLMDTIEFNEFWTGFFGVRNDRFDYANVVLSQGQYSNFDYSDSFWNGHAGLVRAVTENGNVYLTYSTATNINGGESDVGGSCGYGGLCGTPDQVDRSSPEAVENIELGTKWELLDNRLLATAALFRITKDDVMESVGDAYSTLGTLNTGKNRVEGFELSLTGALTEKLSVQASASFMKSEVLASVDESNVGRALANFADDSLYLQLRYQPTATIAFGGAYTYKSEMYGGQPDTAAGFNTTIGDYSVVVPSYDVVDLFLHYYPTETLNFRLIAKNVTDQEYWTAAYRSGSFMYLGDSRSIQASATWEF
jgi:catecholate siderophore receptor